MALTAVASTDTMSAVAGHPRAPNRISVAADASQTSTAPRRSLARALRLLTNLYFRHFGARRSSDSSCAIMHLMYSRDAVRGRLVLTLTCQDGKRVYTLSKTGPDGRMTRSAHPGTLLDAALNAYASAIFAGRQVLSPPYYNQEAVRPASDAGARIIDVVVRVQSCPVY